MHRQTVVINDAKAIGYVYTVRTILYFVDSVTRGQRSGFDIAKCSIDRDTFTCRYHLQHVFCKQYTPRCIVHALHIRASVTMASNVPYQSKRVWLLYTSNNTLNLEIVEKAFGSAACGHYACAMK